MNIEFTVENYFSGLEKIFFHFLLTSMIFNEKFIFICCALFVVIHCFSLTTFEILSLVFRNLIIICFGVKLLVFILLAVHFWNICFYLLPNLGNLQPLLLWIAFNPTFLFSTFWNSKDTNTTSFFIFPLVPKSVFCVFSIFELNTFYWSLLTFMDFTVLLISSNEFLI